MKPETQRKTTPTTKAKAPTAVVPTATAVKPESPKPVRAATKAEAAPMAPAPKIAKPAAKLTPTRDEIARRAYELYLARGKSDGHHHNDWIQAERELLARAHQNN